MSCNPEISSESSTAGRYFWGQGPSFRMVITDNFSDDHGSHFFVSLYGIFKYHNYKNYRFNESRDIHSESADQQIFGMGFYAGYEFMKNNALIRPYGGLGFRSLQSSVVRPEINNHPGLIYPGTRFSERNVFPALDLGIIFLFGTGKR